MNMTLHHTVASRCTDLPAPRPSSSGHAAGAVSTVVHGTAPSALQLTHALGPWGLSQCLRAWSALAFEAVPKHQLGRKPENKKVKPSCIRDIRNTRPTLHLVWDAKQPQRRVTLHGSTRPWILGIWCSVMGYQFWRDSEFVF